MANVLIDQEFSVSEVGSNKKGSYLVPLIALAVLYFMMGFITCLNDTLVPFFKKGFLLSYTESSLVQFYFFLTYGIMSVPAGKIVEKTGYKNGMVIGFLVAAIGAFMFLPAAVWHQYPLFLAALFILAIGIVLLQVAANPYITLLGPAQTASSRLTLIQAIGSIGTTIAPLFGARFILSGLNSAGSSDAVKYPYLLIGILLMLIALVLWGLKLPVIKMARQKQAAGTTVSMQHGIFAFRNLNFGIWAIFFYVGAEVSIGTFLTNYIADTLHISAESANSFVAFYWGAMLAGRLIGSMVLKWLSSSIVLVFCAISAIVLVLVSINASGYFAVWTMVLVGLFNSVMFAVIFSLSIHGLGAYTARASGLVSSAIAGGAVISFGQGYLIDHFSWQIAFILPVVCYTYILFFGINGHRSRLAVDL